MPLRSAWKGLPLCTSMPHAAVIIFAASSPAVLLLVVARGDEALLDARAFFGGRGPGDGESAGKSPEAFRLLAFGYSSRWDTTEKTNSRRRNYFRV